MNEWRPETTSCRVEGHGTRWLRRLLALVAAASALPSPVAAREFRVGEVEGLLDLSFAYGLLARVQGRDDELVGIANGGQAASVNFDDGNLNYDTGVTSNMVKATGELTLRWGRFGSYIRAFAFYDFENELADRARTPLSDDAVRVVGWDVDVREYYLNAQLDVRGMPLHLRVGNQVINWGESRFLRLGVDVVNPVDLVALFQPTSTSRDLFLPQGMVWAGANLTEVLSVEGFYQYDWRDARLPPVGSYFSNNDALGAGGLNIAVAGAGRFSDLGTDLDSTFALPPDTLGFDADFMQFFARGRDEPDEGGQYGFTLQAILPALNASKLALHFVNYHSRLPLINGFTANQNAVDATTQDDVDDLAARLAPIYEGTGSSPEEAAAMAQATASTVTIGKFASETSYFASYPEDIRMLGFSFNTATIRTGTLLSGEVSHHFGFPLQIWVTDVLTASLSPIEFDDSFGQTPLGEFGAEEAVRGFIERDKTQLELGLTQLFGPRLGAAQTLFAFDLGWVHIHDMPRKSDLLLNSGGLTPVAPLPLDRFPTADSLGYRLLGQLTYTSVLGGLTLRPRIVWTHDFDGTTPGPLGGFVEGRKTLSIGLGADFTRTWTADLSYTTLFGAGRFNTLSDRDFVRFNLTYYY